MPVQNQQTRQLINAQKISHKYNSKDLSRLQQVSPGLRVNTRYINIYRGHPLVKFIHVCTLYLFICLVRVTVGNSGLFCCVCVVSF